jgi:Yip1 domain
VAAEAPVAASLEKEWWLRAVMVFQSPTAVFRALRDDSDEAAGARQEPVLALVLLAGIAAILSWSPTTPTLLDRAGVDAVLGAVLVFLAGGMYGLATYWLGGAALYFGARGAGSRGSYRRARHTLAYAAGPLALSLLVVWPVRIAVFGGDIFQSGGPDEAGTGRWIFEALDAAFLAWAIALLVLGIRAVQGWSVVRALVAVSLAGLVIVAVTLVFAAPLAAG